MLINATGRIERNVPSCFDFSFRERQRRFLRVLAHLARWHRKNKLGYDAVQKPWMLRLRVCVCFDRFIWYLQKLQYPDELLGHEHVTTITSDWISRATRFLVDHSNFTIYKIHGTRDSSLMDSQASMFDEWRWYWEYFEKLNSIIPSIPYLN